MKKFLLSISCILFLTNCQTQEEIKKQQEKEEIEKITEELNREELSEESKKWLIDTKTKKVTTVLCMSSSKKCKELEKHLYNIKNEYDITLYYYNIDNLDKNTLNILKNTYELKDYTGYTPYVFIVEKERLLDTKTDITNDNINNYLKEKDIISK